MKRATVVSALVVLLGATSYFQLQGTLDALAQNQTLLLARVPAAAANQLLAQVLQGEVINATRLRLGAEELSSRAGSAVAAAANGVVASEVLEQVLRGEVINATRLRLGAQELNSRAFSAAADGVAAVAEKWKEFDERHHVSEKALAAAGKTKEAVKEGLNKLSALDAQYQVSKKTTEAVTESLNKLSILDQQYQVSKKLRLGAEEMSSRARSAVAAAADSQLLEDVLRSEVINATRLRLGAEEMSSRTRSAVVSAAAKLCGPAKQRRAWEQPDPIGLTAALNNLTIEWCRTIHALIETGHSEQPSENPPPLLPPPPLPAPPEAPPPAGAANQPSALLEQAPPATLASDKSSGGGAAGAATTAGAAVGGAAAPNTAAQEAMRQWHSKRTRESERAQRGVAPRAAANAKNSPGEAPNAKNLPAANVRGDRQRGEVSFFQGEEMRKKREAREKREREKREREERERREAQQALQMRQPTQPPSRWPSAGQQQMAHDGKVRKGVSGGAGQQMAGGAHPGGSQGGMQGGRPEHGRSGLIATGSLGKLGHIQAVGGQGPVAEAGRGMPAEAGRSQMPQHGMQQAQAQAAQAAEAARARFSTQGRLATALLQQHQHTTAASQMHMMPVQDHTGNHAAAAGGHGASLHAGMKGGYPGLPPGDVMIQGQAPAQAQAAAGRQSAPKKAPASSRHNNMPPDGRAPPTGELSMS